MAEEVGKAAGKAAVKLSVGRARSIISPSINIVKTNIPHGIIELVLRGTAAVSKLGHSRLVTGGMISVLRRSYRVTVTKTMSHAKTYKC